MRIEVHDREPRRPVRARARVLRRDSSALSKRPHDRIGDGVIAAQHERRVPAFELGADGALDRRACLGRMVVQHDVSSVVQHTRCRQIVAALVPEVARRGVERFANTRRRFCAAALERRGPIPWHTEQRDRHVAILPAAVRSASSGSCGRRYGPSSAAGTTAIPSFRRYAEGPVVMTTASSSSSPSCSPSHRSCRTSSSSTRCASFTSTATTL